MDFITSHIPDDAYLGTPFTKIHDFSIGAVKTFAVEQSMYHIAECVDMYELIDINNALGLSQMFFENSF